MKSECKKTTRYNILRVRVCVFNNIHKHLPVLYYYSIILRPQRTVDSSHCARLYHVHRRRRLTVSRTSTKMVFRAPANQESRRIRVVSASFVVRGIHVNVRVRTVDNNVWIFTNQPRQRFRRRVFGRIVFNDFQSFTYFAFASVREHGNPIRAF